MDNCERKTRETTEVDITIDSAGNICIDPYYAVFHKDDPIVIKCAQAVPWAVGFLNGRTPTDTQVLHGNGGSMAGTHKAQKRGHFPYSVAVVGQSQRFLAGEPTIFLDPGCPEIIIDAS